MIQMKRNVVALLLAVLCCSCAHQAIEKPIVFRGDTLEYNTEFTRRQCGQTPQLMPEVSGMSCSRTTPGFLWIMSDDNYRVEAITPQGDVMLSITLTDKPERDDWEGLSTGVYQGKNYLFVGGFGDNGFCRDKYYIFYFEEPSIPSEPIEYTLPVGDNYISYAYPDGKPHNTEALMYDNVENILYIIDKMEHTYCSVFSLPMDTVYGTDLQILTKICDLGIEGEEQFARVTAADMTPDGRWIIIKNNMYPTPDQALAYALIWNRKDGESVGDALMRQPEQLASYLTEWQGEAVAWLDSTTFFTTSDDENRAPIYIYTR